jgi:hypothetical protein
MKKFIITEEEKINILKQYNIQEQISEVPFADVIGPLISGINSGKLTYKTEIIRSAEDLNKALNWMNTTSGLQNTIESLFGVKCKTSKDIENSTTPGEYGYAGKCIQIWRFITLLLDFYLRTGKNPNTFDFDTAISNAGLSNIYKDLVSGQDEKGNKFNEFATTGVYVHPMKLKSAFKNIYNKQLSLFTRT